MTADSDATNRNDQWLREIGKTMGVPQSTLYHWWKAFCHETELTLTPRQALDIHKEQFFDWLDEQHRKAEAEKARKSAEERRLRQERDCAEAVQYLCELAVEHGVEVVETKIIDEYHLWIEATGDGDDNDNDSPEDERHTHATHD